MKEKPEIHLAVLDAEIFRNLDAIHSNNAVIEKLKNNAAKIGFTQENIEFLDDIQIENNQCLRQTEIYSQVLASLMDARASIISNNLNIRIKALTLITIAIMLPTLVVSIFSMNVKIPLEEHPHAFLIISGLALASSIVVGLLWWRKKW